MLETLFAFQIKHFLADFTFQRWPWMFLNKGTYWHPGGLVHSGVHGLLTLLFMTMIGHSFWWVLWLALIESIIHYNIDWCKVNLNTKCGLTTEKPEFWELLGLDQLAHQLTYLWLAWLIVK